MHLNDWPLWLERFGELLNCDPFPARIAIRIQRKIAEVERARRGVGQHRRLAAIEAIDAALALLRIPSSRSELVAKLVALRAKYEEGLKTKTKKPRPSDRGLEKR